MDLEPRIGAAPAAYVAEIVTRTRDVLGGDLLAVCLMGSAALGDYRPGRSDIDVAVVAGRPLPVVAREALVAALEHETLPCPARGLELVAYDPTGLVDPRGPAYLINLNTGPRMDRQVSFDPAESPQFWFTLDVAIGRTLGRALLGPPPAALFPELPDALVRGRRARLARLVVGPRRPSVHGGPRRVRRVALGADRDVVRRRARRRAGPPSAPRSRTCSSPRSTGARATGRGPSTRRRRGGSSRWCGDELAD